MHATALRTGKTPVLDADPAIGRFLDAVWMERGLSPNTLAAYRADLTALARWLEERHVSLTRTTRADLLGFIAWRVEAEEVAARRARQRHVAFLEPACQCRQVGAVRGQRVR